MNIRCFVFWLIDGLRGGKVRAGLEQVKKDMSETRPNIDRLTEILQYAINNVPYYRNIEKPVLESFPIMNKTMYRNNYEECQSLEYEGMSLYTYETSGSSGTPFHGVQDKQKRYKHTADLIYFHKKCGWNIGEKYIFLRAWTSQYNSSPIKNIKNNVIPYNVLYLNEKMMADIVVHLKKDKSIKMILGYGSALNQFAEYLEKNNIYLNGLKTVISDSDMLKEENRVILEKHLYCRVVDRYSNEEHGLIAFSYDVGQPFEVNYSSYFVEILKLNSDEPAEKGELGRVVITDLYNRAMPLIRYELGDLAVSEDVSRIGVTSIHSLQGRLADMLTQKSGVKLSSATINNYMDKMEGVEKYQLIQTGIGEFTLYIVEKDNKFSDMDYYNALLPCIEQGSTLNIIRTCNIAVERTGKFKTFVSKCKC